MLDGFERYLPRCGASPHLSSSRGTSRSRPVGWPELWNGPAVGRGMIRNLSGRGGCGEDRKQISLVPYICGRHKNACSSQYGDP